MKTTSLILFLSATVAFAAIAAPSPEPSPDWQPLQVVNLQLEALRNNNPASDDGIAVAYRFASPRNKAAVGQLEDFARMMHSGYSDMLTHSGADLETVRIADDEAVIGVTLELKSKQQNKYLFLLRRNQGEPCDGCWLTDGVVPLEGNQSPPPLQQI